jgi:hypothetical protein
MLPRSIALIDPLRDGQFDKTAAPAPLHTAAPQLPVSTPFFIVFNHVALVALSRASVTSATSTHA